MTTSKSNLPILPPTLAQLQTTLASLQTPIYILAGLTHRNKNQHRGTKWWASFDMLRRSLLKLTLHLEGAIQRAELLPPSSSASCSKRNKAGKAPVIKAAKQPELERAVARAVWVRDVLGPRAYEAFTQLTADRQFAQLGLVLVGVLAQVEAAIVPLLPPVDPERQPAEQDLVPGRTVGGAGGQGEKAVVPGAVDLDLGVAVSRDDMRNGGDDDDDDEVHPSSEPIASPVLGSPLHDAENRRRLGRVKDKKRKQVRVEDEDEDEDETAIAIPMKKRRVSRELEDGPPTTARPADAVYKEAKKHKHKKLLGLELDELPKSNTKLQPRVEGTARDAKKTKKKKKQKGGDEFDDLFSTLL